jgi:RNA polymerase sigma-70 factor (ECF subfamily)
MNEDKELLQRAAKGDHAAFEQLVTRYKAKILTTIHSMLGPGPECDDIAQEIFLSVYFSRENFRHNALFSTWLYRITINKCHDALRKRKHREVSLEKSSDEDDELSLEDHLVAHDNVEAYVQQAETRRRIAEYLRLLPERYRAVLLLRDVNDLSYSEIARIMNERVETIKVVLFRARQRLRTVIVQNADRRGGSDEL